MKRNRETIFMRDKIFGSRAEVRWSLRWLKDVL
jgi:hypothetical protein